MQNSLGVTLCFLLLSYFAAQTDCTVKNFRVISWNTDGGRWDVVADLMNTAFPSGGGQKKADLMAIQEAGSIRTLQGVTALNNDDRAIDYFAGLPSPIPVSEQYQWTHQKTGQTLFLYYIELVKIASSKTPKQNLAIVSRTKVDSFHLMRQEIPANCNPDRDPSCLYKYRPSVGVEIEGAYFFSIHPRPTDTKNEAKELVDTILHEMTGNFLGKTWLVLGDFNREPTSLNIQTTHEVKGRVRPVDYTAVQKIVATPVGKPTRERRRLDYGIIGGPQGFDLSMTVQRLKDVKTYPHKSDHEPILFNF